MKLTFMSSVVTLGSAVAAYPTSWEAPGPNDVRGPCPMLNTLANHGFLPHDGKNINVNNTAEALSKGLNLAWELGVDLHDFAVMANPQPNATTFDLDHLSRHNVLEHDGSLSRQDAHFGPPDVFNEAVFNQTVSYWTGDVVTMQMAANARLARLMTSNLTNPEYSLSDLGSGFSIGESVVYLLVLGNKDTAEAPKNYLEYWFRNERLPYELGWERPNVIMTGDDLGNAMDKLVTLQHFPQSPGKITSDPEKASAKLAGKRHLFH
ncbi:hypothetical protein K445DRAFT_323386 [Daldinia sp. EC12]|nr:Cloroperoxidase [Daldinia eschscholtzii]OTB09996.1 hypothetical protein K445DRAFT_323386 [Daldinia sp. EC12]